MTFNNKNKFIKKTDIINNIEFIKSKIPENDYKKLEMLYMEIHNKYVEAQAKIVLNENYMF